MRLISVPLAADDVHVIVFCCYLFIKKNQTDDRVHLFFLILGLFL